MAAPARRRSAPRVRRPVPHRHRVKVLPARLAAWTGKRYRCLDCGRLLSTLEGGVIVDPYNGGRLL